MNARCDPQSNQCCEPKFIPATERFRFLWSLLMKGIFSDTEKFIFFLLHANKILAFLKIGALKKEDSQLIMTNFVYVYHFCVRMYFVKPILKLE